MTWLLSFVLKFLSSGLVDKVTAYMERKAALGNEAERDRNKVRVEAIRAAVQETQIMADLQKSKFEVWAFWVFAALFVVPLAGWWNAVILDSIFKFGWGVASVPVLTEWGAQMIQWLFYAGSAAGVIKMLK